MEAVLHATSHLTKVPEKMTSIHIIRACVRAKSLQSYPALCNPVDHTTPGASVQEILQARTLEWVAMPSSRGSSHPRDQTHISSICIGRQVLYYYQPLNLRSLENNSIPESNATHLGSFPSELSAPGLQNLNAYMEMQEEGVGTGKPRSTHPIKREVGPFKIFC